MSDEDALPVGWVLVPLARLLAGIETGKSFKCDERPPRIDEVGVVKVSAVTWGTYQERESKTCTDPERINPVLFVQSGDFLFSRANTIELVGACVIAQQVKLRVMLSDKILRFRFVSEAMKPWVFSLLRSKYGRQQIEALASGNQDSMRNIGQERIGQILVPLPPSPEQARIVDKLEELLSDLDAGVAELKAAQRKLAQNRQSLLKAAVEGKLTAAWRERNGEPDETGAQLLARILRERRASWEAKQRAKFEAQGKAPIKGWQDKYPKPVPANSESLRVLPAHWVWASVDQIGDVQLGRQKSPEKMLGLNPTKYIRAANITERGIDFDDVLAMDFSETERTTFELKAGDVLLTEASGSPEHVGRPVVWPAVDGFYCFQNTVLRFRPQGIGSEFAFRVFQALQKLGTFRKLSGGVGINHLSAGKFSVLPVPLPPLSEQVAVVDALESAISVLAEQDATIQRSLRQSAAQRKNILQAAFSGQLVPQDPNDEPASVLLERIRVERAALAASTEGRKSRKPRAAREPA